MKWKLFFISCSLFYFISCSNQTDDVPPLLLDSSAQSTTSSDSNPALDQEAAVLQFIRDSLHGWTIPEKSTWENYWYKEYHKGPNTIYRVQSDFDGNTQTDYAFILKDSTGRHSVWSFLRKENTYKPYRLYDIYPLPEERKLQVGLGILDPGSYDDVNSVDSLMKRVSIQFPAVHVLFFETASKAYYWKDTGFHMIQTGD